MYEVLTKYSLLNKSGQLVTDDGPENKGALTGWLNKPGMLWKKLVAQIDIVQSNSMVEAAHKILKHRYLFCEQFQNVKDLNAVLPEILDHYNTIPLHSLTGYTPTEVLQGAIPDKLRFTSFIQAAHFRRLEVNQEIVCNNTC